MSFGTTTSLVWLPAAVLGVACGRLGYESLDDLSVANGPSPDGPSPPRLTLDGGAASPSDSAPNSTGTSASGQVSSGEPNPQLTGGVAPSSPDGAQTPSFATGPDTSSAPDVSADDSVGGGGTGNNGSGNHGGSAFGGSGSSGATESCDDGELNQDEVDVDCGGSCDPCDLGQACVSDVDCASATCITGLCHFAGTCDDGELNQDETDIDCGGSRCRGCDVGFACNEAIDCVTTLCETGICRTEGTCNDSEINGNETDVDCGGASCATCEDGFSCTRDLDCTSGSCVFQLCQGAGTCSDSVQNQDETDTDCGGTTCLACPDGASCESGSDCESSLCASQQCTSAGSSCLETTDCTCDSFGGHAYWFCRSTTPANAAPTACADVGMALVRIDDADENDWIVQSATAHGLYDRTNILLIGATKVNTSPDWVWPDGEAFWTGTSSGMPLNGLYSNWNPVSPKLALDCSALASNGTWSSLGCAFPEPFVCETAD